MEHVSKMQLMRPPAPWWASLACPDLSMPMADGTQTAWPLPAAASPAARAVAALSLPHARGVYCLVLLR